MNIDLVKKQIESKTGRALVPKSCTHLSADMLEQTGRSVSPHTLKRFFGFVKSITNPSNYTLETIAIFLGKNSWKEIQTLSADTSDSVVMDWEGMQEEARKTARRTLKQIKRNSGINYDLAIARPFIEEYISDFLNSDKIATALIAPGGYGKSISVCKLVEHFWMGENPLYPEDIVWLITANEIAGHLKQANTYGEFITQTFSPNKTPVENVAEFFELVKIKPKGRVIIVLDAFDEITTRKDLQKDTFRKLMEYFASIKELEFCKFIITIRTSTWKKLSVQYKGKADITNVWFGASFEDFGQNYSNIPLLSKDEIFQITRNYCSYYDRNTTEILFERFTNRLVDLINQPFYLQLFLQSYKSKNKDFHTRLDLIQYYAKEYVFEGEYGEEKIYLIRQFCELIDFAKNGLSVEKSKLNLEKNFSKAYAELLSFGVFSEEKVINKFHSFSVVVTFSHTTFLDYFIATLWIEKFNGISQRLFEEIAYEYEGFDFRQYILHWVILMALKEKNHISLRGIFNLPLSHYELSAISEVLGFLLRDYDGARKDLTAHYAKNSLARLYYFDRSVDTDYLIIQYEKDLEVYLKYNTSVSNRLQALTMQTISKYFQLDRKEMLKYYKEVSVLEESVNEIHPIVLGRKYGIYILFEKALNGKVSDELVSKIFEIGERIPVAPDEMSHFPCFHFHLLEAFVFSDMPKEALRCLEHIKVYYPYFDQNHQSGLYQILGAYSAWVIAKLGQPKEALEMLKQVDTRFFGLKIRNYFQIELDLIWADVLMELSRHAAAIPKLNSVINRSRNFKFKWSESKATYMMGECYGELGEGDLGKEYCGRADMLNSDQLFIAKACTCE